MPFPHGAPEKNPGGRGQMDLLRDVLQSVLEDGGFAKPAPGLMPAQ